MESIGYNIIIYIYFIYENDDTSTGIAQGFAIGKKQAIVLVIYVFQEAFMKKHILKNIKHLKNY